MPILFRWMSFLGCVVAVAATFESTQGQSILDDRLPDADIVSRQNAATRKIVGQRRNFASEDQLRDELFMVPEVGFDRNTAAEVRKAFVQDKKAPAPPPADLPPHYLGIQTLKKLAEVRPEVAALPWEQSIDRQLNRTEATVLQNNAMELHLRLEQIPKNAIASCSQDELRTHVWGEKRKDGTWDKPDCLPAIIQVLQVQPARVRGLLVEQLARIPGPAASKALAQRAIFDLSPQVREQAVQALQSRPASEYREILLSGMRWPWRSVTENSAEALVRLPLKKLQKQLEEFLTAPDPTLPYVKSDDDEQHLYVKEVVRMNHSLNCLLCHPASQQRGDLVRGVVPIPGSKIPSRRFVYYSHMGGDLVAVRADNTALRQDFSLMHPMGSATETTAAERFDYFLRERRATPQEIKLHEARANGQLTAGLNIQREAARFVLHELQAAKPIKPVAQLRASASLLAH